MLTLPRTKEIPDPLQVQDKNSRRRILSYKPTFSIPKEEDVKNIIQAKKKIDEDLETYEALQDFSRFEKRMNEKNASPVKKPIIDKNIIEKYNAVEGPGIDFERKFVSQSQQISPRNSFRSKSQLVTPRYAAKYCSACNPPPQEKAKTLLAPPWNVVDEPLSLLPKKINDPRAKPPNSHPWYGRYDKDNPDGIPIYSRFERKYHEEKLDKYQQAVRYQLTLDRKKREDMLKKSALRTIENTQMIKEKTDQLYIKSGQGWCLDEVERRRHINDKPPKPKVLDAIDLEAIKGVDKRDQEERELEKCKKKNPNVVSV